MTSSHSEGESGVEQKGCDWIKRWALGGVGAASNLDLALGGMDHGGGALEDTESAKGWDSEPVVVKPKQTESKHHGRDGRPMTPDPDEALQTPQKNRSFLSRVFKSGSKVAPATQVPTSDYNAVAQALFASLKLSSTGAATSVSGSVSDNSVTDNSVTTLPPENMRVLRRGGGGLLNSTVFSRRGSLLPSA